MWKHIIGHIFTSRDVILGVVGKLDSRRDFCHSAWTMTLALVPCSLHSPLKKAESKKDIAWTGQGGPGLLVLCDLGNATSSPTEERQRWLRTALGKSSGCTPLHRHVQHTLQ